MATATPPTVTVPTQTFTPAQKLAMYEHREAMILMGAQEYASMGQSAQHAALAEVRKAIKELRQEVAAAAGTGVCYASQFRNPE